MLPFIHSAADGCLCSAHLWNMLNTMHLAGFPDLFGSQTHKYIRLATPMDHRRTACRMTNHDRHDYCQVTRARSNIEGCGALNKLGGQVLERESMLLHQVQHTSTQSPNTQQGRRKPHCAVKRYHMGCRDGGVVACCVMGGLERTVRVRELPPLFKAENT